MRFDSGCSLARAGAAEEELAADNLVAAVAIPGRRTAVGRTEADRIVAVRTAAVRMAARRVVGHRVVDIPGPPGGCRTCRLRPLSPDLSHESVVKKSGSERLCDESGIGCRLIVVIRRVSGLANFTGVARRMCRQVEGPAQVTTTRRFRVAADETVQRSFRNGMPQ